MTPARASAALLLLAACIEFDPSFYSCKDEDEATDCPTGSKCENGRCSAGGGEGGDENDLGSACRAACDHFYDDCGFAAQCQNEGSCPYFFLEEPDSSDCTNSCREDPEGTTPALLLCYSRAECSVAGFAACEEG
jgi:hypothetical protein